MKVGSLFSGIGGFDLGLERAGMEIVWQVENNPFCNKVLEKHWPNVKRYGDIKNVTNPEPVDLICGGFPCQPYSCAGKRLGAEDDRALWPEMFRIIQEARPTWVIGENVAGFINMGLDDCIFDLEGEGYEVQPFVIPACAVNAPHRRDRVWIVANAQGRKSGKQAKQKGWEDSGRTDSHATNTKCDRRNRQEISIRPGEPRQKSGLPTRDNSQGSRLGKREQGVRGNYQWDEPWIEVATRLCRVDDGLPRQVDRVARLKALGNAVVPQIVEIIGRAIMEIENA